MPPSNSGLDVCSDGKGVGSKAIYNFLSNPPYPLLSLHGHIHESPNISGVWKTKKGKTICIQPGQSHYYEDFVVYVIIDLKNMKFTRSQISK
ncbi:MAG: hypothetical protein EU550_03525 [Promethearchaeota archaeon]|nr:MAG: hypothetical protein EU550_03525 [Candidatus Lokiarchaeota archaeon]